MIQCTGRVKLSVRSAKINWTLHQRGTKISGLGAVMLDLRFTSHEQKSTLDLNETEAVNCGTPSVRINV